MTASASRAFSVALPSAKVNAIASVLGVDAATAVAKSVDLAAQLLVDAGRLSPESLGAVPGQAGRHLEAEA